MDVPLGYTIKREVMVGAIRLEAILEYVSPAPQADYRLLGGPDCPWRRTVRPPNLLERLLKITLDDKVRRAERRLRRWADAQIERAKEWAAVERMFKVGHGETSGGGRRSNVPPPPPPADYAEKGWPERGLKP